MRTDSDSVEGVFMDDENASYDCITSAIKYRKQISYRPCQTYGFSELSRYLYWPK